MAHYYMESRTTCFQLSANIVHQGAKTPAICSAKKDAKPLATAPIWKTLCAGLLTSAALGLAVVEPSLAESQPRILTVGASGCYMGVGSACDDLSAGNELIKSLQQKSRENKDKTAKELRDRYYENGYADYFMFGYDKKLVHTNDGQWLLQKPENPFPALSR
mmetsp:Transcript_784/g.1312  ORF Transcript_784/g.1312 Transcript_784/m.1312 type:complete len:162 (-) Transcript_784:140-625(-)|eukprot:CAMPEP_0184694098 /NCGR_PEP_ID=MMETSP0313-20130426/2151_1 /TAXON_ID=2792 /ORGANISM="Porphyridium aerugineum, Strain SAG 1380-2" /LENGTH=161 /DNA_ID=CAMNT_0027152323 /DNA_START=26 /DNA_END=511 /DNA_ORIENTATION=-